MNANRILATVALGALVSITACEQKGDSNTPVSAAKPAPSGASAATPTPAPDNTASNKQESGTPAAKTPLDQSQAAVDIKVTADIRKAIMDDKTMSMNAQNCKIITDSSGMVTLRGVVDTQAEKDAIEAMAKVIAGDARVVNQLEVKAS